MALADRAMLVALTIHQWGNERVDRTVDEAVESRFRADKTAGKYDKNLFDPSVMRPIGKAAYNLRKKHNELTLPWTLTGTGLLPAKRFLSYREAINELRGSFNEAVGSFLTNYDMYKSNRRIQLGALFNDADYPSEEELRSAFWVETHVLPIPTEDHFMVDLEQEIITDIKKDLSSKITMAEQHAMAKLYQSTKRAVETVCRQLADGGRIFESSFEQISLITGMLPDLNIVDDRKLEEIRLAMQNICGYEAEDVRRDDALRRAVLAEATKVLDMFERKDDGNDPEEPQTAYPLAA